VARYGGREFQVDVALNDPAGGVSPGSVTSDPPSEGLWFEPGTTVSLAAVPRTGFTFREWGGELAGRPNPTTVTVEAPMAAEARFDLIYAVAPHEERIEIEAAVPQEIAFEVREDNEPVSWTVEAGVLPEGLVLQEATGRIVGAAMVTGVFPLEIQARDAIGLEARVAFVLEVAPPTVSAAALVGPFLGTGVEPTALQRDYLDRTGNGSGDYDIGDVRAFVVAHPELPASLRVPRPARIVIPVEGFGPVDGAASPLRRGGEGP
jgi:hypothetical protein